jgi:hypothetical protein
MDSGLGEKYRRITTANNELALKAERSGNIVLKERLEQANNANMALVTKSMDEAIAELKQAKADLNKAEDALGKLTTMVGWLEKLIKFGIGVGLV